MTTKRFWLPRPGALRVGLVVVGLFATTGLAGCTPTPPTPPAPPPPPVSAPNAATPCRSSAPAAVSHVVWIVMENKAERGVVGNPSAPYLASLARRCGLATNNHGVAHPSLPNYVALTSASTAGVTDDRPPSAHPLNRPSIFDQVTTAKRTWKSYEDAMPSACRRTDSGTYAVKHNPAAYYTPLAATCAAADVPYNQLAGDLAANRLPAFSFITPDLCHDMHNCGVGAGDTWLSQELPKLLDSQAYRSGSTVVAITWDEDDNTASNQIPLYVIAPSVRPGTASGTSFAHPALLHMTEQMLGLPTLPGATGGTALRSAFHL
ncbi:MAG: phosphatidylinositol-3-phosphatase [Frankiaceae bacterium]|nr:phosphatidylinositol-3-phosphatase [Frankiaceae bacterium]